MRDYISYLITKMEKIRRLKQILLEEQNPDIRYMIGKEIDKIEKSARQEYPC
jgi:hypothetical protein